MRSFDNIGRVVKSTNTLAANLTVAYAKITLDTITPPQEVPHLGLISLKLTAIAGGAGVVTWYLDYDGTGNTPRTPEKSSPIVNGSGVAESFDLPYRSDETAIYVWAKVDVGTATLAAGAGSAEWVR